MPDPALPETYNKLPDPLKQTLAKSHQEYVKGWPGRPFAEYINDLDAGGHLAVIRDVYARCAKESKLWPVIQTVIGPWTYAAGHNISQGFNFLCDKPDDLYGLPLFARKAGCSETKIRLHAYIRPISEQYALALMAFARGCLISSTV